MKFNHDNNTHHFVATSWAMWATTSPTRTLKDLLAYMEKEGQSFNLFYVPVAYDAEYEIKFYKPQVDNVEYLGLFEPNNKVKTK